MNERSKIDLLAYAQSLPSMGGRKIGPFLRELAANVPGGTNIVEVGTWLGSGTAHLALGLRDRSVQDVVIHCFDRFEANDSEAAKASKRSVELSVGQDTLPVVREYLSPFGARIEFHRGELRDATWSGGPISLYVDDAAKRRRQFDHVLRTFAPHWIPGVTKVVLMDYLYWQKNDDPGLCCQQEFIEQHSESFTEIARPGNSTVAFLYTAPLDFAALRLPTFITKALSIISAWR